MHLHWLSAREGNPNTNLKQPDFLGKKASPPRRIHLAVSAQMHLHWLSAREGVYKANKL
jgi:hypothetical protein